VRTPKVLLLIVAAAALATVACSGGGPREVRINEAACGLRTGQRLVVGKTNRIILDNRKHDETQIGMNLILQDFPVVVHGQLPEGSTIGSPFSTIRLHANPGETASVDVEPTYTGSYDATCELSVRRENGTRLIQQLMPFDLK